ncbi:hypothetical protein DITRI_Ditri20bG0125600 [Diplodiscus trichospermus]
MARPSREDSKWLYIYKGGYLPSFNMVVGVVVMASKNCGKLFVHLILILMAVIQSDAARPRHLGNENGILSEKEKEVVAVGKQNEGKTTDLGEMKNLPPFPYPLPDMPFAPPLPLPFPFPDFPPFPFPPPLDIPNVPPFPDFPLPPFPFPPLPFLSSPPS